MILADILGIVLLCMSVGKLIAICHAVQWLKRHGGRYFDKIKAIEDTEGLEGFREFDFYALFDQTDGKFFPVGVKDYRLKRFLKNIRVSPLRWVRIGAWLLRGVCGLLFRYMNLTVIVASDVMLTTLFTIFISPATAFQIALMRSLFLLAFALNITILIEFIVGSIVFSDYMKHFHMIDEIDSMLALMRHSNERNVQLFRGIKRLSQMVGCMALTAWSAVFFSVQVTNDFNVKALEGGPFRMVGFSFQTLSLLLVKCLYFVTTTVTTIGYGDIYPTEFWGFILTISLHLQVFTIIMYAATVFWAVRSDSR
jgi:hypothetical protein